MQKSQGKKRFELSKSLVLLLKVSLKSHVDVISGR